MAVSRVISCVLALALGAAFSAGCGGDGGASGVSVGEGPDGGDTEPMEDEPLPGCDMVEIDGDLVIEHEQDFTATYRIGEPYEKTIMLFGGEAVTEANVLSNAYALGLDKVDALALAEAFPDFYLCSSPGGDAAADQVRPYDFIPADCEVYEELVTALQHFARNHRAGGDRTSIRFEGAPLELVSVIDDASGADVSDQVHDQVFHLITSVEQLSGESVLSFGTSE